VGGCREKFRAQTQENFTSVFVKKQFTHLHARKNEQQRRTTRRERKKRKKNERERETAPHKKKKKKQKKKKYARRSTVGRVLRRARERPGRARVERDGGASGREHREEQFRSGWLGQGILLLARVFYFLKGFVSLLRFGRKKSTAIIVSCSSCCCSCCCSSSSKRFSFVSNGIDFVRAPTDERPLFLARALSSVFCH